jgi:hypothetical protein
VIRPCQKVDESTGIGKGGSCCKQCCAYNDVHRLQQLFVRRIQLERSLTISLFPFELNVLRGDIAALCDIRAGATADIATSKIARVKTPRSAMREVDNNSDCLEVDENP